MPENFNDRPHKNEKNESIAYVKSLIEQMRTNGKSDDVPKLEKLRAPLKTYEKRYNRLKIS